MPKVDPYAIRRRTRVTFERKLVDSLNPDIVPVLYLRKLSGTEQVAAMDLSANMIVRYVTGKGQPGTKDYEPPELLPPVDGEPVFISESTARVAAFLAMAQTCGDDDRYDFEQLVTLMASDGYLEGMQAAAGDVLPDMDEEGKPNPLAPTASGETSSLTASTEAPATTPA